MPGLQDLGAFDDAELPLPDNFYDDYEGRLAASRRSCTRNSCGCRNSTTTPWSRNWLRGISKIQ